MLTTTCPAADALAAGCGWQRSVTSAELPNHGRPLRACGRRARREGKTVSQIAREALEEFVK